VQGYDGGGLFPAGEAREESLHKNLIIKSAIKRPCELNPAFLGFQPNVANLW
jgi:hypothetical protein